MTFMPLEAEGKSRHREIQWVSLEGRQSLEKMTSEDACLTQVQRIAASEPPNLRDLSFRDPDPFQTGQLRTQIGLWENFGWVRTCKGCLRMVGAWGGCQNAFQA